VLFKIAPGDFVVRFRLVSPALAVFEIGSRLLAAVLAGYCLPGCSTGPAVDNYHSPAITPIRNARNIMDMRDTLFIMHPEPSGFSICFGHTCRYFATLSLSDDEWGEVRRLFDPQADTPEKEREAIREAVALLESIVGMKTGTAADKGENIAGLGQDGQMDCVDESTNTSVYLTMLQGEKLLKWHVVDHRTSRGISSFQVPHFTAVIKDIGNNQQYAVDSWFLDNGEPPFVLPLPTWKNGWRPDPSL
jgi:hypothetical protein